MKRGGEREERRCINTGRDFGRDGRADWSRWGRMKWRWMRWMNEMKMEMEMGMRVKRGEGRGGRGRRWR